jgi:nucleotide-binding universal stress UspA family protein
MFKIIMVGVDGSKYSEEALKTAIEIAKPFGSKLVIATVYAGQHYLGLMQNYTTELPPEVETNLNAMLSKYKDMATTAGLMAVEIKIFSVISNLMSVGAGLVIEAEKMDCSMIVVGTRGWTGIKRTLLGSVADYVVRNAHCDVHVVRHK